MRDEKRAGFTADVALFFTDELDGAKAFVLDVEGAFLPRVAVRARHEKAVVADGKELAVIPRDIVEVFVGVTRNGVGERVCWGDVCREIIEEAVG